MKITLNSWVLYAKREDHLPWRRISFLFPEIAINKKETDFWCDEYRIAQASFPTLFYGYKYPDGSWGFTVRILGFGFGLSIQKGY